MHQLVSFQMMVYSNVCNDRGKRADTKWVVVRNGDVMVLGQIASETHMATGLAGNAVSQAAKLLDQFGARNVAR